MYACMQACMYLCMYLCMYSLYEGGCVYRVTNKRKHKTKQTPVGDRFCLLIQIDSIAVRKLASWPLCNSSVFKMGPGSC